jgi:hypothetical protein
MSEPDQLDDEMARVPCIAHERAEFVGTQLHRQWTNLVGTPAPSADNLIWADLVQFVLRAARAAEQNGGTEQ